MKGVDCVLCPWRKIPLWHSWCRVESTWGAIDVHLKCFAGTIAGDAVAVVCKVGSWSKVITECCSQGKKLFFRKSTYA